MADTLEYEKATFTEYDSYLFHEGRNFDVYRKMGARICEKDGVSGALFTLWAQNAKNVSVTSLKTGWENKFPMEKIQNGIWEAFVPGLSEGDCYRYIVEGCDGITRFKADPYAFRAEKRPGNASVICSLDSYCWEDGEYFRGDQRSTYANALQKPMAIYEVHLGSWKKDYSKEPDGFLNYREIAPELAEYVRYMGYTHVELIGICEHPLDASWGYQVTGFYAPTSRYGTPDDFRSFVDIMHRAGIGVILDWVPAHFPKDPFGLENFDGSPMYEFSDPLRAEYPEWGTKAFDHGKNEVRNYLISNAFYWVREFHVDALRVDAVAAMLFTSFGRSEWRPNKDGGIENIESISFLKELNEEITGKTGAFLIAEDSSIMAGITKPVSDGGFGFLFKWNMGWMNETLKYIKRRPIYRGWHHDEITHAADYAFTENFVLVLSHDEVVHLKAPMVEKFSGNLADKLGGLKTLYTYQMTHPGKKLLFMGQDFAENREWSEERELDWHLCSDPGHRDVMITYKRLLEIYKTYPCLYSDSSNSVTFEWVNRKDAMRNTISYIRRNPWNYDSALLVICNFAPSFYKDYTCGVPVPGSYRRVFSTYDNLPGEGGPSETGIFPEVLSSEHDCDGYKSMITYSLRPYESVIFEIPQGRSKKDDSGKGQI